jgi:hypothetical protein
MEVGEMRETTTKTDRPTRLEFMKLAANVRRGIATPGQFRRWAEELDRREAEARASAEFASVGGRFRS